MMLRAIAVVRKPMVKEDHVVDAAWLDHKARQGGKGTARTHGGLEFLIDLGDGVVLSDGDALKLDDGRLVQVRAAPQSLIEIRAENPLRLLRFAWHLGGRHTPAELRPEAIYIEEDATLSEMARGQGCRVMPITRPFQPERSVEHHVCEHHDHHGHASHGHGHHHGHGESHGGHSEACGHDHGPKPGL